MRHKGDCCRLALLLLINIVCKTNRTCLLTSSCCSPTTDKRPDSSASKTTSKQHPTQTVQVAQNASPPQNHHRTPLLHALRGGQQQTYHNRVGLRVARLPLRRVAPGGTEQQQGDLSDWVGPEVADGGHREEEDGAEAAGVDYRADGEQRAVCQTHRVLQGEVHQEEREEVSVPYLRRTCVSSQRAPALLQKWSQVHLQHPVGYLRPHAAAWWAL